MLWVADEAGCAWRWRFAHGAPGRVVPNLKETDSKGGATLRHGVIRQCAWWQPDLF